MPNPIYNTNTRTWIISNKRRPQLLVKKRWGSTKYTNTGFVENKDLQGRLIKRFRGTWNGTVPVYDNVSDKWYNSKGQILRSWTEHPMRSGSGYTYYLPGGIVESRTNKGRLIERRNRFGEKIPSYIGGSANQARQKFIDSDIQFRDSINAIAKRYNISPSVLASRISKEGVIDFGIQHLNSSDPYSTLGIQSIHYGPSWGLDDFYTHSKEKDFKIKEPWMKFGEFDWTNEKDRKTKSAIFNNWSDGISATAAELKWRAKRIKENNPNIPDYIINTYMAPASFNLGLNNKSITNPKIYKNYKPFINVDEE